MSLPTEVAEQLDRFAARVGQRWRLLCNVSPGLSAARTYKLAIGAEEYALRDWQWSDDRLAQLQTILRFQAELNQKWRWSDNPIPQINDMWNSGASILHSISRQHSDSQRNKASLWSLAGWLPGEPRTDGSLKAMAICLARLHYISLCRDNRFELSNGWQARLRSVRSILEWHDNFPSRLQRHPQTSVRQAAAVMTDSSTKLMLQSISAFLKQQSEEKLPSAYIVADLHVSNWLWSAEQVSGIVDFGAARFDWPGWDLVRLISTLPLETNASANFTTPHSRNMNELLDAYRSEIKDCFANQPGPTSELAERLNQSVQVIFEENNLLIFDRLQTVLSLRQWVVWIDQGVMHVDEPAHQQRLEQLLQRWSILS